MANENQTINLVGNKNGSTIDTILRWALYVGRLLVILTEGIALFVFISRFSLDRQLVDLNDNIKRQQAQVEFFKQGETSYRKEQLRLSISKTNDASSAALTTFFNDLMAHTNNQLKFTNLSLTATALTITTQAPSADILSAFVQEIKLNPRIVSMSIDRVENKSKSALIDVTINAQLQNKL
jgi:hypothetical protein